MITYNLSSNTIDNVQYTFAKNANVVLNALGMQLSLSASFLVLALLPQHVAREEVLFAWPAMVCLRCSMSPVAALKAASC